MQNAKCKMEIRRGRFHVFLAIGRWQISERIVVERRGEDLEDRMLEFAARVGKVVDALPDTRLARHIAGQLVVAELRQLPTMLRPVLRRASVISFISWESR